MQLRIDIPRDKEHLVTALAREAERTGRSENEVILEAIEQRVASAKVPVYRTYPLAAGKIDRAALYEDRIG